MSDRDACAADGAREGERCALCADAGEVAEVIALGVDALGRGRVRRRDGGEELVAFDLVDARPGDRVLVHLGFVLARVEGP
ncbi:MAG TPA: hydrogenase assembly protein HupF [Thermoanaerobaculia bacterium]|nr:hydrogenase assembly protein HupF [Thermoanaerobaculia bacterium]